MMWNGFGGNWGGMMAMGALMMVLFWGAVIVLVVWAVRSLARGGSGSQMAMPPGGRAVDILKERYARGEITKDQYEAMRRDIET